MVEESKLSFLFRSTTLHGFKHLADESSVTWKKGFARIFWTTAFALSFFYMTRMLGNVFKKAGQSTAIMPDTTYLQWTNAFPAISLCIAKGRNTEPIKKFIQAHVPENQWKKYAMRHYRVMQSTMFLNTREPNEGITLEHCTELNDTCGIDIDYARKTLIPRDCNFIIDKMFFLGREIKCEEVFKLFETEMGTCFIANSIYSSKDLKDFNLDFSHLPLTYKNTDNVDRVLEIHYKENDFFLYKFSIHSPEELPDGQSGAQGLRKSGLLNYVAIKTVEYVNQEDVLDETPESRQCRFPSDRFSNFSLPYCRANCLFLKRVERELAVCNCTLPAGLNVTKGVKKCTMKEIDCVAGLAKKFLTDLEDKRKAKDVMDKCLTPTCTYMEISKVGDHEEDMKGLGKGIGVIRIEVINKPTLRYVRRVQFTTLDIIVQVGGIIGLFFGASFLSILEIFYLVFQMIRMKKPKPELKPRRRRV